MFCVFVKKIGNGTNGDGNYVFLTGIVKEDNDDSYTVEWDNEEQEEWNDSQVEWGILLFQSIGLKISKHFGADGTYHGQVVDVLKDEDAGADQEDIFYKITYEDGDGEEFDKMDLLEGRKLHQTITQNQKRKQPESSSEESFEEEEEEEKKEENENDNGTGGRRRRSTRSRVSYKEVDDDVMNVESDEEEIRQARKRGGISKNLKSKKQKRNIAASDDEEFEVLDDDNAQSDADLDDDIIVDDDDDDDEKEDVIERKPAARKKATAKTSKKPKELSSDVNDVNDEFEIRLITERNRVKPNNNPQKLPKYEYCDPVGVDPTHGIIERIIEDQVRSVGLLLRKVQARDNHQNPKSKGDVGNSELSYPIRLQTACSGTDAPSIALGLIKESLSRLSSNNGKKQDQPFEYEHIMSCEIEPFKQAYIARNFPGVPLFPDITKLSAIDEKGKCEKVVDVYGRPQYIPNGEIFVAGTSCKDFSMLKTTRRKDIQDKGQSGETFLAAVEFLDLHQPPFAIFENVDGAPWSKMQEYIQGRIYLPDRNINKAIASSKRKDSEFDFNISTLN